MAEYALKKAVTYAAAQGVQDTPIGAHQSIAHPLAEVKINLEAVRR
jgi:alkylation response protein AidB-like acyl-CoA dehydrogenase